MRTIVLSMAAGLLIANMAAADCCSPPACTAARTCCGTKHFCRDCGAERACQVVCETRKVKKTVWRIECEDYCVPLPSCSFGFGNHCNRGCCDIDCAESCGGCCESQRCCGDRGCEDPCADLLSRKMVPPKCGKVRTRKKLIKDEITCEVPTYKCVVAACNACGGCSESIDVEVEGVQSEEELPEAPAPSEAPLPPEAHAPAETPTPARAAADLAPLPPILEISYEVIIKGRQ